MASFDIIMPKMGESIEEATITNWFVKEGDQVEEEDVLLEIATDKVDSEIPSPVDGVVKKILFAQDEVVAVGTVIAVIDTGGSDSPAENEQPEEIKDSGPVAGAAVSPKTSGMESQTDQGSQAAREPQTDQGSQAGREPQTGEELQAARGSGSGAEVLSGEDAASGIVSRGDRFYSPLVKKIAREENISQKELDSIQGSGLNGRVQKNDVLNYLEQRKGAAPEDTRVAPPAGRKETAPAAERAATAGTSAAKAGPEPVPAEGGDEVIEMSRMRKLIAGHMIRSKQTSAHVTNMLEVDVTSVVHWRNRVKEEFQKREGVKLTYLPVFLEATVKTLKEYPQINASVEGERIILKRRINLGVAVSLPEYNLIVPNIKDADTLNLAGITKKMNGLASAARSNKLNPDDIQGGTFTVTNFGSFQNDIGTPIINQPEVAILAVGAIKKKPSVVETEQGDMIAIRHMMWLSLTYDHRIIDGALGGAFLRRLGDYIESFDPHSGNFKL